MVLPKPLGTAVFRWVAAYLALFVLATGLIVVAVLWRTNTLLTEQALQVIAAEARGLREQYRSSGLPQLVQTVSERSARPGDGLYLLVDGTGNRLAGNLIQVPAAIRDDPNGGPFHYPRAVDNAAPQLRLAVGLPIRVGDQAQLFLGRDIEETRTLATAIRTVFLIGMGALSLLALLGAALYSRRLLGRVDAIATTSQRIMSGDLTQRLAVSGIGDEMDRLAVSLNQMLERIEQLMSGLREVSDNIAHDLKTPLTRLRNRAEAALRDPEGGPAYREGLERTLEEADELIKTFNALLSIARLEAGSGGGQTEAIDIGQVVRDAVELYEPVMEDAGHTIALGGAPSTGGPVAGDGLIVFGNRQLLGQALANLIENAMKYGCDGDGKAWIIVSAEVCNGWIEIVVGDRGAGIPASDRERVFKRFVRLEASRTRPGTGLGLSLVAAVARLHKGAVRLEDNAPGLRVILSLPIARPGATMSAT